MELTLKTDRLVLQQITEQDFDFVVKLETRPENRTYEMGGVLQRDIIIEECKEFIEGANMLPVDGAIKYIVSNEKGEMIGSVSLSCNWNKTKEWEIGYIFLSEHWDKGYASEAVKSVIKFAFNNLGIHKLMAFINAENKRSVALAKRIGMVEEGYMREARIIDGNWNDEFVFTLLKKDLES